MPSTGNRDLLLFFALVISFTLPVIFPYLYALLPPFRLPSFKSPSIEPQLHPTTMSSWFQKTISLPSKSRGSYLVTDEIASALPEISNYRVGLLTLFIQHTSCALSLNENWDSDVRADMSDALDRIVVEDKKNEGIYRHDAEGSDDMPAHIKSALIGASVTIPITNGRLNTGTWQGRFDDLLFVIRANWIVRNLVSRVPEV